MLKKTWAVYNTSVAGIFPYVTGTFRLLNNMQNMRWSPDFWFFLYIWVKNVQLVFKRFPSYVCVYLCPMSADALRSQEKVLEPMSWVTGNCGPHDKSAGAGPLSSGSKLCNC